MWWSQVASLFEELDQNSWYDYRKEKNMLGKINIP